MARPKSVTDTPEQIEICLKCTRPNCTGNCPKIARYGSCSPNCDTLADVERLTNEGKTAKEIARKLNLTVNTVNYYRYRISSMKADGIWQSKKTE
jgi:hypothetical protein